MQHLNAYGLQQKAEYAANVARHIKKDTIMAFITETRTNGITLTQRFTNLRENFAAARAQRKIYKTTVSELETLSSRELADLGLSRSSIKSTALEAAYGK